MNKKFLSAILFGALMVTSTGTFVSCKDYDDDIENLQGQIDKNSSAIAELQKLVGAGNWVTSISPVTGGFTVTMSNGQSQTITGINGADGKDGKNGTEWTIGEDGFWYMDGEKTDNVAIGKNGENGVTAPSPSIGADGNWVVYNWDAEKGEFVAEATEIPAQGTAAYAVEANGVITLHIADANGEYMEVVLPATSDSFVVSALAKEVKVEFEIATWKKWTAALAKSDEGKALLAKYPEIAELKKNDPMKQGGMLPLIVTPANVDLADGFKFHLQDIYGKFADIELSAPVKGAGNLAWNSDVLVSRAAEDACLWSLAVEPAYDAKKKTYATAVKTSLVAENEKGTAARTAFAYTFVPFDYDTNTNVDVKINSNNGVWTETDKSGKTIREGLGSWAPYAESIDLFAGVLESDGVTITYPISFEYEYNNHYIIVLNDALQAEKYGLSMAEDGHTLNIAKMPESELKIEVELKVIALGLNGSVDTQIVKLSIGQEIAATAEPLADKEITLGYVNNSLDQKVLWNIADLGFSATQLDQFLKANKTLSWTYTDEDGKEWKGTESVVAYKKDGKTTTTSYKDAVTFGFVLESDKYVPAVYDVRLVATLATDANSVIYASEATMTVKNPTMDAIKLVPEFVEDDVLQIVGKTNGTTVTYALKDGLILGKGITVAKFEDIAFEEWNEAYAGTTDNEDVASVDWIASDDLTLTINAYDKTKAETDPAHYGQLNNVRRIRATYSLFGNVETKDANGDVTNPGNYETFEFDVIVKSAIYSETPTEVVTIPEAKLTLSLTDDASTEAKENAVDIAKIYSAVYAYGPNAGKAYNLWNTTAGSAASTGKNEYNVLNDWKVLTGTDVDYVSSTQGLMIEIALSDLAKFGYSSEEIIKAQSGDKKYFLIHYANSTHEEADILTWSDIYEAVKDLTYTVDVEKTDASGNKTTVTETRYVFPYVAPNENTLVADADLITDPEDATKKVLKVRSYNATRAAKWIELNPTATETIKMLGLYETYYSSVAYNKYVEQYSIKATDASGLCADLTGAATIEFVDATTGKNFASLSGTTITAGLASNVHMTTDEVEVPFKLIIKDKWGMTMEVPFTITVTE